MKNNKKYCNSLTEYSRFKTREVMVGKVGVGGENPILKKDEIEHLVDQGPKISDLIFDATFSKFDEIGLVQRCLEIQPN